MVLINNTVLYEKDIYRVWSLVRFFKLSHLILSCKSTVL